jgi:hypothetical protein
MNLLRPEGPITSWDSDNVVLWLNYIGLGIYAGDVKRWVKTGQQLLDASPHELEKELGVKVVYYWLMKLLLLACLGPYDARLLTISISLLV